MLHVKSKNGKTLYFGILSTGENYGFYFIPHADRYTHYLNHFIVQKIAPLMALYVCLYNKE